MGKSLIQADQDEGRSGAVSADSCGTLSWAEQIELREGDICDSDVRRSVHEEFRKLVATQFIIETCQNVMQQIRFPALNVTQ